MNLPPPILTSEPGSFARKTFEVRIPRIVNDTILANDFPTEIQAALNALHEEIVAGLIAPLRDDGPDRAFWDTHSQPYIGRSWTDVPWYWAETFFYRRMLAATRYFQPGAWFHRDPYANQKDRERDSHAGPHALAVSLEQLSSSPKERLTPQQRFRALLHSSLWGNRADLSYNVAQDKPGSLTLEKEHENLIIDDAERVWEYLQRYPGGHIHWLCDNAGTELLFDLALADCLFSEPLSAETITLHLKLQPFFVSDAMVKDAQAALEALAHAPGGLRLQQLGERLQRMHAQGRLVFAEHWFATTCLFYFEMPDDLRAELAGATLVISKGDANYRRLLGDAHWDPVTPFALATGYFPAPLIALRTLKSEIVVGLPAGRVEQLNSLDPEWMVNGKRGLVQFKV